MTIVFAIHGTKSKNDKIVSFDWWKKDGRLEKELRRCCDGELKIVHFDWSGENKQKVRLREAVRLRQEIENERKAGRQDEPVILVAHSHGGNVAMLACVDEAGVEDVRVITIGTPFLSFSTGALANSMGMLINVGRVLLAAAVLFFPFVYAQLRYGFRIADYLKVTPDFAFTAFSLNITHNHIYTFLSALIVAFMLNFSYVIFHRARTSGKEAPVWFFRRDFAERHLFAFYHRDDEALNSLKFDRNDRSRKIQSNPALHAVASSFSGGLAQFFCFVAFLGVALIILNNTSMRALLIGPENFSVLQVVGVVSFGALAMGLAYIVLRRLFSVMFVSILRFYLDNTIFGRDNYMRRVVHVDSWPGYCDMSDRWEPIEEKTAGAITEAAKSRAHETVEEIRTYLRRASVTTAHAVDTLTGILENTSGKALVHNAYFLTDQFYALLVYTILGCARGALTPTQEFLADQKAGYLYGKNAYEKFAPKRVHFDMNDQGVLSPAARQRMIRGDTKTGVFTRLWKSAESAVEKRANTGC